MRVFVTGATGWVGSAVVHELLAAGHDVIGLARSDAGAATLRRRGARFIRGSLADLDSLRAGAAEADGVIHTAYNHDFSQIGAEQRPTDRRAIEAIGDVTRRLRTAPRRRPRGPALIAPGRLATEDDTGPIRRISRGPRRGRAAVRRARAYARPWCACRRRCTATAITASSRGLIGIARAKGRLGLCGRGTQPLARGASARCGPSLPAGAGEGSAPARAFTRSPNKACRSGTSPA